MGHTVLMRLPNIVWSISLTFVMTGGVPLMVVLDPEVAKSSTLRLLLLATARKTRRPKTRTEMIPTVMEEMVAIPMLPPAMP